MKVKTSNFADYVCICPGVQQIIGIPLAIYHLCLVVHNLTMEIFYKEYTSNKNHDYDVGIEYFKIRKLNCFMRTKKWLNGQQDTGIKNEPQELFFDEAAYNTRYENRDYKSAAADIYYRRSRKIDSLARIADLGYAIIRFLPIIGSCYSFYVYKTSTVYIPLIPRFSCGGDD